MGDCSYPENGTAFSDTARDEGNEKRRYACKDCWGLKKKKKKLCEETNFCTDKRSLRDTYLTVLSSQGSCKLTLKAQQFSQSTCCSQQSSMASQSQPLKVDETVIKLLYHTGITELAAWSTTYRPQMLGPRAWPTEVSGWHNPSSLLCRSEEISIFTQNLFSAFKSTWRTQASYTQRHLYMWENGY